MPPAHFVAPCEVIFAEHLFPQLPQLLGSVLVLAVVVQVPVVHDWQPEALQALLQQCLSAEQKPVPHSFAALQVAPPLFFGKQDPFEQ